LLAKKVAAGGQDRQMCMACRLPPLPSHVGELAAVVPDVGRLVRHDQVVLRINCHLDM
jgi:hypothetical protein